MLRIKTKNVGKDYQVEQMFADDGDCLPMSSVASYYKGAMLVGTIRDKLAYCKVEHLE